MITASALIKTQFKCAKEPINIDESWPILLVLMLKRRLVIATNEDKTKRMISATALRTGINLFFREQST
jgi:hypothetical protein